MFVACLYWGMGTELEKILSKKKLIKMGSVSFSFYLYLNP